ncbi:hypothetical protein [Marinilabilia salmonicolor]|uniref:hypothetical protein n=1 Tax=Marinilabilia salmonicolor TaxID=989 RepID=UPI001F1A114F|nr:hypothetical protein [Marinilabilia salmonicolor]
MNVIGDCSTAVGGAQGYWYGIHGRVAWNWNEAKVECKPGMEHGPNAPGTRRC